MAEDTKFKKGRTKTGGRKAGTPNKITKEKREIIAKFIDDKWDEFISSWDDIKDPKERCQIMVSLLPFAFPKLAQVDYKDNTPVKTLADELDELSGEKTRK